VRPRPQEVLLLAPASRGLAYIKSTGGVGVVARGVGFGVAVTIDSGVADAGVGAGVGDGNTKPLMAPTQPAPMSAKATSTDATRINVELLVINGRSFVIIRYTVKP
jgi:hypothetical protein